MSTTWNVGISVEISRDAVCLSRARTPFALALYNTSSKESLAYAALRLGPEVNFIKPRDRA